MNIDVDTDIMIDPDNLDVELVQLPNLLFKYGELATEAEKKVREAQENVKTVRSRLILYANENPEEIEGGKATVQSVEAFYRNHPDHVEAREKEIQAEYEASMVKNAISAIYTKRQSLENLIRLLNMEYFSGPSVPGDLSNRVEEAREETRGRIAASLNTSPKKKASAKRTKTRSKKTARRG